MQIISLIIAISDDSQAIDYRAKLSHHLQSSVY